ncbi:MAM and LDL-receptor class A domain-containing protein 1-like isoform X2 [Hydractinia symbiolongicarpus]|uniref:MAM and LDL-receptor class A domain-containing protein 1-like isoform X2 n=1 Tax=Hydractinia symbiolongicarpus TaxID=13093 RepID=UPI00254D7FD2|nr:MAM and LDL-receptor class A domain-containing protein 1-like isoform X2 [Hydractinia symbiolongicarpus]
MSQLINMLVIYQILLLLAMMVRTSEDKFDCSFETPSSFNKTMCQFTYSGNHSALNRWTLHSGRTNTRDTGPYNDHTYGDYRGHYLYFEASSIRPVDDSFYYSNDDSVWIKDMPAFNGSRCMMFWLHMYENSSVSSNNPGKFHIAQVTKNSETVLYRRTTILPVNAWMLQSVNIPSSPEIYHLQFYGRRVDYYGDKAIDDVKFYPVNCSQVEAWKSQWSNWGAYGTCSATCQSNVSTTPTQFRTRTCNGGIFGTMCNRSVIERRDCNVGVACPDKCDCSFETPSLFNKTMCQFTYSGNHSALNRWTLHSGRTKTDNTGPYNDHTYGDYRGHYLYFEASLSSPVNDSRYYSNDDSVWIKDMPAFSGSRCMMFWLHMYENSSASIINPGKFHIAQVTKNLETVLYRRTTFLPVNAWMLQSVDIPSSPEIYHLQFYGSRVDYQADKAIDDVKFYPVNCSLVKAWKSQWSNWGAYGTCSATCQSNVSTAPTQFRTRTCNGGIFGTMCNRSVIERGDCNVGVACPGSLTPWSYDTCSATCQSGLQAPTQQRTRTCVGATFGGNCSGSLLFQITDCNVKVPCPGSLTPWSAYGACSASCQLGLQAPTQQRRRTCVRATFGGNCNGALLVETTDCNVKVPCTGVLSQWTQWSTCTETCQTGATPAKHTKTRTCTQTSFGGNCGGRVLTESRTCNARVQCPDNKQDIRKSAIVSVISIGTTLIIVIIIVIILKCKGIIACNTKRRDSKQSENDVYDYVAGTATQHYEDVKIQDITPSNYAKLENTTKASNDYENIHQTDNNVIVNTHI